jgi:hypothetical protein
MFAAGPARIAALLLAALAAGCATIGPATIPRDRFDYAAAISESWKNQMLLNLVKARYADAPVFLDIASAINSYSVETGGNAAVNFQTPLASNSNSLGLSGGSKYTDRPTITYNPLIGEKFGKSLMTPIPPGALLSLIQAGWNAEMLLRCCVHSINGLDNFSQRAAMGYPGDPEFADLIASLTRIQRGGGMGVRITREKEGSATVMVLRPRKASALTDDFRAVRNLLGLDADADEIRVIYGAAPKDGREIAILTRSMLEILLDMSSYISVPPDHVAQHRAAQGFEASAAARGLRPLLRVHSGVERPADAFVTIHYQAHWFWIDDTDLESKGVFSFLMFLFTLTESGGGSASPVLTVPAG